MLLHSRERSGERRLVDVNALVEESPNLAYRGARAEKQGFNVTLQRSFDPSAGEVDAFPRFVMEFAQSAPAALQRIGDAQDVSLIIILSDINMPGMTGLELLPKAKALRPDVPVIMITAYGDAETKRRALEGGAETLLTKPIDFEALRSEIDVEQA